MAADRFALAFFMLLVNQTRALSLHEVEVEKALEDHDILVAEEAQENGVAESEEAGLKDPRKIYLAKFIERSLPATSAGAAPGAPLRQCIVTPTNASKCTQDQEARLRRNKAAYADFHGYELRYADFQRPQTEWSTGRNNRCHAFWNKVDYVLDAIKDGCNMVMYMDTNIALTNMGLELHQFLDKTEDAIFNEIEHFEHVIPHGQVDHGMFVVRGSAKAVQALVTLKTSTHCARNGVIETGLASDKWNLRVLRKQEAAVFSSEAAKAEAAAPGELTWKRGDFSVQFQGDKCSQIGDFMEDLSRQTSKGPDAYTVLRDIEARSSDHRY